jgi:hypothetical protein
MGPGTGERWLARNGDVVVVRVDAAETMLLLTSLRPFTSAPLTIDVRRLDATGFPESAKAEEVTAAPSVERVLSAEILLHVRNRGDVVFFDGWAGFVGQQSWVEGFGIKPLEEIAPSMIEYRAVTSDAEDGPWTADGEFCGSRSAASPLIGFAVRLKPEADELYDCQYSGSFLSGAVVGPLCNGQICRSAERDDPLDGIYLRIVERRALTTPAVSGVAALGG